MVALGSLLLGAGIIVGFVCGIIILIDAFKNEVWKGLLYIFCGFYALYYAFAEFQHESKVKILLGAFLGPAIGVVLFMICGGMSAVGH